MFFRVWFLYLSKFFALLALATALLFAFGQGALAAWLRDACAATLFACGLVGAGLALWLLCWPYLHCPLCGEKGEFCQTVRKEPGVDCPHCGFVYVRNMLLDFDVTVMDEDADSDG